MAFSVVMIMFSTIVTGIVELLVRLFGLREKNLVATVESLFENVVWPGVRAQLSSLGDDASKGRLKSDFVNGLTGTPVQAAPTTAHGKKTKQRLFNLTHRDRIEKLAPLAFAQRLARTDVGKAIQEQGEQRVELLIQDFSRSFDRYSRVANEVFRKRAKPIAIVVGILLALTVNIDANRLFISLMNNPDLRENLVKASTEAAAANAETARELEEVRQEIETGAITGDQTERIQTEIQKINAEIAAMNSRGLPIGHSFFPYCAAGTKGDGRCARERFSRDWLGEFGLWLAFTVLAGVLIGLGGPFWFRVFSSLSQVFQMLRAFGVRGKEGLTDTERLTASSTAEESAKPKNVVDAFSIAARVHHGEHVSSGRALLGPDGRLL